MSPLYTSGHRRGRNKGIFIFSNVGFVLFIGSDRIEMLLSVPLLICPLVPNCSALVTPPFLHLRGIFRNKTKYFRLRGYD